MKKIFSFLAAVLMVVTAFAVTVFADSESTVNIYFGALNEPYSSLHIEDESGNKYAVTRTGGNRKPFVGSLSAGNYTYVFEDSLGEETARGSFYISAGTEQNIYLKRIDFEFNCYNIQSDEYSDFGANVVLKTPDDEKLAGTKTTGSYFTADGKPTEKWSFVVEAKGTDYEYCYSIVMNDGGLVLADGEASGEKSYAANKSTSANTDVVTVTPVADFNTVTFKVTKRAGMGLYKKTDGHYAAFYEYEPANIDTYSDEEYDIYTYNIPKKAAGRIHMTAGGSEGAAEQIQSVIYGEAESWNAEYLKTVRIFSVSSMEQEYTVDVEKLDNSLKRDCIYSLGGGSDTVENDMLLNVPDSSYINLCFEPFELRAYRVNQAQYGAVENYFIEPDFHYEVVSGSSVMVTPAYSEMTGMPEAGNEYAVITPIDIGVSIIKVTYDAMLLQDGRNGAAYFNAVDEDNVRYIVVNVTEEPAAELEMGISLREYDTVYYTAKTILSDGTESAGGDCAAFTFTPESGTTISVQCPNKGEEWEKYTAANDGSFTVKLYDGENIIKAEKNGVEDYYVVSAKGITVKIENKTNPGKAIKEGENVRISFIGLRLPNKKLAGIYNPGYPNTTWVHYSCAADECSQQGSEPGIVKSRGAQYVVASEKYNGIEFTLLKSGTITLKCGQIHSEHMGSALNAHRLLNGTGVKPNLDADNNVENAEFSLLPDITLSVSSNQEQKPEQKPEPKGDTVVIKIGFDAAEKGEQNPNTGAEVIF